MATVPRRLGDILIDDKLITPFQRDEALRQQKLHGGRIGTNLVELGAIDLDGLARALARQKGVPAALQKHFDSIHGEAVGLVPAQLAEKLGAIPLGFTARSPRTIAVAFLDPTKPGAIEEIQSASNSVVYPVIAPELRIVLYLEKLYWIPRPMRFLRLDLANAKTSGPSSTSTPARLPPKGNSTDDPNSFFDMTRPDLSQRRPGSAILLTEALPGSPPPARAPVALPRAAEPPKAETASDLNAPRATPSTKPDPSRPATSIPAARQTVSMPPRGAPVAPRPAGPPTTEAVSSFGASRATPAAFTNPAASPNAVPLVPAPAPVAPVPGSATSGQPIGSASRPPPRANPPPTLPTAATPASNPRSLPTPPPWRKPPEVLQRRSDRTDASSRAPTIPDIPSFAIVDEEPEPMQFRPEVVSGAFEPSASSSATTIQIDAPLPPAARASAGKAAPASASGFQSAALPPKPAASPKVDGHHSVALSAFSEPADSYGDSSEVATSPFAKPASNGADSNSTHPATGESAPLPWSTVEAVDAIAVATNRDQVGQAIANYLRSACGVGLVLIVQHEVAMGWKGFAPGVGAAEIEGLAIPLAAPSALQIAHQQQSTFRGPPPLDGVAIDRQLSERLRSSVPKEVIVSPVIIRDRVVNLVYGHAEDGGPLPDRLMAGLGTLTRAASAAYVRLIQESKKKHPS